MIFRKRRYRLVGRPVEGGPAEDIQEYDNKVSFREAVDKAGIDESDYRSLTLYEIDKNGMTKKTIWTRRIKHNSRPKISVSLKGFLDEYHAAKELAAELANEFGSKSESSGGFGEIIKFIREMQSMALAAQVQPQKSPEGGVVADALKSPEFKKILNEFRKNPKKILDLIK